MKFLVLILALSVSLSDLTKISKVNHYKNIGETAYKQKDYKKAIEAYKTLVDSFAVDEDPVLLNLANAYFNAKDTSNASYFYNQLLASNNNTVKSTALTQLGVLKKQQNKLPEALSHFKNALKANPENADARYDYELLKKMMKDQENKDKNQNKNKNEDQNKDQQQQNKQQQDQQKQQQNKENQQQNKQNQQNQNQQQSEQDKQNSQQSDKNQQQKQQQQQDQQQKQEQGKNQQSQEQAGQQQQQNTDEKGQKNQLSANTAENLKKMNISEERAKMILEAMKNNEIQYIQQNERKPTKRTSSNKPDW